MLNTAERQEKIMDKGIVVDTNVLVSAILSPDVAAGELVFDGFRVVTPGAWLKEDN